MTEPQLPSTVLAGGGLSGELFRSIDWSKTPVGPVARWPRSLLTTVQVILHSRHPDEKLFFDTYTPTTSNEPPAKPAAASKRR